MSPEVIVATPEVSYLAEVRRPYKNPFDLHKNHGARTSLFCRSRNGKGVSRYMRSNVACSGICNVWMMAVAVDRPLRVPPWTSLL